MNNIEMDTAAIKSVLAKKKCFFGFDAFIDMIMKPLYQTETGQKLFFRSMGQFAEHIISYGGMSKSVEVESKGKKIGGNNPIMSNALACLGAGVSSVGAYGEKVADSIFSQMNTNVKIYPVAAPGLSISYEFEDSKLMTYTSINPEGLSWRKISDVLTNDKLISIILDTDAIALLNFAETPETQELWYSISQLLKQHTAKPERIIFFDLSDITKLEKGRVQSAFDAISDFAGIGTTYLSVNENEFIYIYKTFVNPQAGCEEILAEAGLCERLSSVCRYTGADYFIFRSLKTFYSADRNGCIDYVYNSYCPNPVVLTGAGDNQNAGILAGLLCNMPIKQALSLGAATGSYYIANGVSCDNIENLRKAE